MIILFGSVGSGKTAQGDMLMKLLDCPRVSTSQLLRQHSNPEHLRRIAEGSLVDDEDVIELLEPELKRIGAEKNEFIMDGSPRSVAQAKWMVGKIEAGEIMLTAIIHLKVSKEVVIDRLMKRGREDDSPDIISHRLDEYERHTNPVLDYFRQQGYTVHDVDGELPPEEVDKQILKVLGR